MKQPIDPDFNQAVIDDVCERAGKLGVRLLRDFAMGIRKEAVQIPAGPARTLFELRVLAAMSWCAESSASLALHAIEETHGETWARLFRRAYEVQAKHDPAEGIGNAEVVIIDPARQREDLN